MVEYDLSTEGEVCGETTDVEGEEERKELYVEESRRFHLGGDL